MDIESDKVRRELRFDINIPIRGSLLVAIVFCVLIAGNVLLYLRVLRLDKSLETQSSENSRLYQRMSRVEIRLENANTGCESTVRVLDRRLTELSNLFYGDRLKMWSLIGPNKTV